MGGVALAEAGVGPSAAAQAVEGKEGRRARTPDPAMPEAILEMDRLSLWYGDKQALREISMRIPARRITAFIGPSGCGKSTLLRCVNRLNDLIPGVRIEGDVRLEEKSVLDGSTDVHLLRRRVGMVFQKSNPFPKSIYDNVVYGLKLQGVTERSVLDGVVEHTLRRAALWEEVADRLHEPATALSGGQQQRLCIARAIAVEPEVILYDEPCSALDPISTARIEELMLELKEEYTQVIVTHNMQQASRVSDLTAFMYLGELVEYGVTEKLFVTPMKRRTEDYITGRFG